MTTRFIMVRHAETPGSLERRFTGTTDVELPPTATARRKRSRNGYVRCAST